MPIRKRKKSFFTKLKQDLNIVPKKDILGQDPENSLPCSYHDNAHTCPLSIFIKCLCDDNYNALTIAGKPTLEQLQLAWFGIYMQFVDLSGEDDIKLSLRLITTIYNLKYKILKVENMVAYLALRYDEKYIDEFKLMGYHYKFDWLKKEAYSHDLKLVLSRLNKFRIEIELHEEELKAIEGKGTGEKVDRAYFTRALVRLSNHNKYRINPAEVTVAEYCALKTEYEYYIKQIEIENNARKG